MRKFYRFVYTLILPISIALSPSDAMAQDQYYPLLDTTAVWNFERVISCQLYSPYYHFHYSLILWSDTVIDGTTYLQLKRPAWEFSTSAWFSGEVGDCGPNPMATGYLGALREDTTARRVHYLPAGATEESLLYDFSLEIGDTITGYLDDHFFFAEPGIISAVDSVLIGSQYHKRWNIPVEGADGEYHFQYIEGIGGLHGLVDPDPFYLLHSAITTLTCYSNGQGFVYPDGDEPCAIVTHAYQQGTTDIRLDIFPNPASGTVTLNHSATGKARLQVFGTSGKLISQHTLNTPEVIIDTENWPRGMYLLRVVNKGNSSTQRLVVH